MGQTFNFALLTAVVAGSLNAAVVTDVLGTGGACVSLNTNGQVRTYNVVQGLTYQIKLQGSGCTNGITLELKSSNTGNQFFQPSGYDPGTDTYTFDVSLPPNGNNPNQSACFTYPIVWACGNTTSQPSFTDATGTGGEHQVHLRASTFTNGCSTATEDQICTTDGGGGGQDVHLRVCKFYDANNNGVFDATEALPNWKMTLDGTPFTTGTSAPVGCTDFTFQQPSTVNVTECLAAPYTQTALLTDHTPNPISTSADVFVSLDNEVDFGNNCPFQANNCSGGSNCTIGFYKNNCSKVSASCSSKSFTIGTGGTTCATTYAGCSSSAPFQASATNMLVMLRAQELATKINVCQNSALADAFVVIPAGNLTGLAPGAKVSAILAAADAFIGGLSSCDLTAAGANRNKAEAFKNLFDQINNYPAAAGSGTGVIINPTPCTPNSCLAP